LRGATLVHHALNPVNQSIHRRNHKAKEKKVASWCGRRGTIMTKTKFCYFHWFCSPAKSSIQSFLSRLSPEKGHMLHASILWAWSSFAVFLSAFMRFSGPSLILDSF